MNELDNRIIAGINHFRKVLHGEFKGNEKVHLNVLFNLIEERIRGHKVNLVDLETTPRMRVGDIFPESEGYKVVNDGGLNNEQVVSPDETASRQPEPNLGQ